MANLALWLPTRAEYLEVIQLTLITLRRRLTMVRGISFRLPIGFVAFLVVFGVYVPSEATGRSAGCFEFWDWKTGVISYKHGGAGEEPEEGWTYKGKYFSELATGHDYFDGGKAEDSHATCEGGGQH